MALGSCVACVCLCRTCISMSCCMYFTSGCLVPWNNKPFKKTFQLTYYILNLVLGVCYIPVQIPMRVKMNNSLHGMN